MHDWTLVSIFVEWAKGKVEITLNTHEFGLVEVVASELVNLSIPKNEEWGKSVSVNAHSGPLLLENGNQYLSIEMQSGDNIELEAKCISTSYDCL